MWRRLQRNLGSTMLSLMAVAIFGFAAMYFNARALGVELFGIYASVLALSLMLEALAGMQCWQAIVTLSREDNQASIFGAALAINMTMATIAAIIGIVLVLALGLGGGWAAILHMATLVLRPGDAATGVLRRHNRFGFLAAVRASVGFAMLGVALLWYIIEAPLEAYLVSSAMVQAAQSLVLNARSLQIGRPAQPSRTTLLQVLGFILPSGISGGIGAIRQGGMLVLVGSVAGASVAGLYAVADRISGLMRMGYHAAFEVLFREMPDLQRPAPVMAIFAGLGLLISGLAMGLTHLLGPWLIGIVAGAPFVPAAETLTVLIAAVGVTVITLGMRAWIIVGVGPGSMLTCNVIALLALAPAPILIQSHGLVAAAWTVLGSEIAWTVAALYIVWQNREKLAGRDVGG